MQESQEKIGNMNMDQYNPARAFGVHKREPQVLTDLGMGETGRAPHKPH